MPQDGRLKAGGASEDEGHGQLKISSFFLISGDHRESCPSSQRQASSLCCVKEFLVNLWTHRELKAAQGLAALHTLPSLSANTSLFTFKKNSYSFVCARTHLGIRAQPVGGTSVQDKRSYQLSQMRKLLPPPGDTPEEQRVLKWMFHTPGDGQRPCGVSAENLGQACSSSGCF